MMHPSLAFIVLSSWLHNIIFNILPLPVRLYDNHELNLYNKLQTDSSHLLLVLLLIFYLSYIKNLLKL